MHMTRACAPILLLATFSTGCDIVTADRRHQETAEWRKVYEIAPGGRLEVSNTNGQIQVERSSGSSVEVLAVKTARGHSAEDAKRALERVDIVETSSGGVVRVETRHQRSTGWFTSGAHVRYSVRIPNGVHARFATTNGGVELQGVAGTLEAETTNGGITARDVSGSLTAVTTNGGVDADLRQLGEGGARLECTNGGIRLRLPADAKASITASVTNGGIDTGGLPLEKLESSRRKLEARLNGGGPPVRMDCTNGGLSIRAR